MDDISTCTRDGIHPPVVFVPYLTLPPLPETYVVDRPIARSQKLYSLLMQERLVISHRLRRHEVVPTILGIYERTQRRKV